ncbi:RNA polymerase sigma-70 factor (ECF subfamily) [Novosphingobium chloroacetimidivorans]|uniref:RNA polymerase sigma-70 factor (ECF subfamily) n=1 Tax=Novosphingobium chloroacetimidivorans TaxID=1428314 RepID=A0A7W7KBL0_9SPHN|nr:sigma-70 family RNA polymerase sigma factor [Novosphingobium chloroacetimidivorans]MBB4859269.1 RNA polymerase sigma-70 factor (ECF subfamily) [Novosphingobium chloroacetimidivorans]
MRDDQRAAAFEAERARMLRFAYRMLGSVSDAEDIVQDAWLRWDGAEGSVDFPVTYLTRIVARLCIDRQKSARARRETYVGPWLPDPLLGSVEPDEMIADDVTVALMLAMERLTPLERAAFLLHDVFEVALPDVAAALDREPATVRQLASRARKHVHSANKRFIVEKAEADRLARAFFKAANDGDIDQLSLMLAQDVEIHSDGGGKVIAFLHVVRGLERVLRLFAGLRLKGEAPPTLIRTALINGLPGFVSVDRASLVQTTALDVRDGKIIAIYIVRNPDKLGHVSKACLTSNLSAGTEGRIDPSTITQSTTAEGTCD